MRILGLSSPLGWVLIVVWLGLSGNALSNADAELFERLGSVGVVAGILAFATQSPGIELPPGYHRLNEIMSSRILDNSRYAHSALRQNHLLVEEIRKISVAIGRKPPSFVDDMVATRNLRSPIEPDWVGIEAKDSAITEQSELASTDVSYVKMASFRLELTCVVFGTLQWGFGKPIAELASEVIGHA